MSEPRTLTIPEGADVRVQHFSVPLVSEFNVIADAVYVGSSIIIWHGNIPPGLKDEVEASIKKWMDGACQPVRGGR